MAEVTAPNQLTVVFRTKGEAYVAGNYGWITIANFDLSNGTLVSYYNFGSKRFESISPSDTRANGPYYDDGNNDPFNPTYICNYDLKDPSNSANNPYKAAIAKFSDVFNPSQSDLPGSNDSSVNKQSTKPGADDLTGISKKKDTLYFATAPEYGTLTDKIINFSAKDKDVLQFSKSAFGLSVGKFVTAKTQKKLNKALASDVDIVYNQPKGELIFNANGPEAGFGVDGGVFAQLVGAPKLTAAAVSFI